MITILHFLVLFVAFWITFVILFTTAAFILRFLEKRGVNPDNWY